MSAHYIHWIFYPRTKLCISSRRRGTSTTVDLNDYGEKIISEALRRVRLVLNIYFSVFFPRNWRDNNVQRRRSQCASFYLRIGTVCQYFVINSLCIFIFPHSFRNWKPHTHWNRNWRQLWGRFLRWSRVMSWHRNSIASQPANGMKYFSNSNKIKWNSLQIFIFFQMYFVFLNHKVPFFKKSSKHKFQQNIPDEYLPAQILVTPGSDAYDSNKSLCLVESFDTGDTTWDRRKSREVRGGGEGRGERGDVDICCHS